ncbi:hypothetical protein FJY94_05080 [Candidatus Kaiserbacteria bacterium]|nr:hypothetical protein [Candidatus Kaiserbacteria bacterium]
MRRHQSHPTYVEHLVDSGPIALVISAFQEDLQVVARGRELRGSSPFHREKTPSFFVNHRKNKFFCFSSGLWGNALDYLVWANDMHQKAAVRFLEDLFGKPRADKWQRKRPHRRRTRKRGI